VAVGDQATNEIDQEVDLAAMTGMFDLRDILKLVNDRFDDGTLMQQELIRQRDEHIFHL